MNLHDVLYQRLRKENLPEPQVSEENKYYFREIAVGWKLLDIKCEPRYENYANEILEKLKGEPKKFFEKLVELKLVDRYWLEMIMKKELATKYGALLPSLFKFVDYVCVIKNTAWIMEGKEKLNYEAIGQVLTYSYLFSIDYPQFEIKKAIICEEGDPLLEKVCQNLGITVFVLSPAQEFSSL